MKVRNIALSIGAILLLSTPAFGQDDTFAARRHSLMTSIEGGLAILFSDPGAGEYDKNFYYLTGMRDRGSVLLLAPGEEVSEVLFNRSGDWDYASENRGAEAYRLEQLPSILRRYARGKDGAHVPFGDLGSFADLGRIVSRFSSLRNVDIDLAPLRAIKDDLEIELLRNACRVTAEGLNDVFRAVEAGMQERDLSAQLDFGFKMRNSSGYSFLQAASGPNSTHVHFGAGDRHLEDGDLIVFDVGALWEGYTADISRTIPVSGRFTQEQREIYTVVLNSQKAAIQLMQPNATWTEVRLEAQNVLIDGLHELGLVLDTEDDSQRNFFIAHGYYHFIGLDIHDVWSDYLTGGAEQVYEPGMVMTMEPGLYFPADRLDQALARLGTSAEDAEMRTFIETIRPVYEKYVGMGVRIEDDVLITADGNEILTSVVPKEIDEIEALMEEPSPFRGF